MQLMRGRGVFLGERQGVVSIVIAFFMAFEDMRNSTRIQGNVLPLSGSIFLTSWLLSVRHVNHNVPIPVTLMVMMLVRLAVPVDKIRF
jgi:hypothetical protein